MKLLVDLRCKLLERNRPEKAGVKVVKAKATARLEREEG